MKAKNILFKTVILYISGSMYKNFFIIILLLSFFISTAYSDNSSVTVEIRGTINHSKVRVKKQPDKSARNVRTLYKNAKVVVIGEEGDWYKIKINNIRNGYVLKKYVDFLSTLKKENKKIPYEKNKALLEVKSLIERFNLNLSESMYYEKEKLIPYIAYMGYNFKKNSFKIKIHYKIKNIMGTDSSVNLPNPFQNDILSLIEVMFFKMMLYKTDLYVIDVYVNSDKSDSLKKYAEITYKNNPERFNEIKNSEGKIWDYIKVSIRDKKDLFKMYP